DWVWIDIHSLYKLSVKLKKESTKVLSDPSKSTKTVSIEECYCQIVLLCLAKPAGLMQTEIVGVFNFLEKLSSLISFEHKPIDNQSAQCIILTDEDQGPHF